MTYYVVRLYMLNGQEIAFQSSTLPVVTCNAAGVVSAITYTPRANQPDMGSVIFANINGSIIEAYVE